MNFWRHSSTAAVTQAEETGLHLSQPVGHQHHPYILGPVSSAGTTALDTIDNHRQGAGSHGKRQRIQETHKGRWQF